MKRNLVVLVVVLAVVIFYTNRLKSMDPMQTRNEQYAAMRARDQAQTQARYDKYSAGVAKAGAGNLNQDAIAFVRKNIPLVLANWDTANLWHYCVPKYCASGDATIRKGMENVYRQYSSLGDVTSMDETTGRIESRPFASDESFIWGTFYTPTHFEHGGINVGMDVKLGHDGWEVMSINIQMGRG